MKLLTTALALAAVACAWAGSTPSLEGVWHQGAETVPPVATETNVDGEDFKTQLIAAFDKYLKELDAEMDRQDFWATVSITQSCEEHIQQIIDKQHLVVTGIASPTEFDYNLRFLDQEYTRVIDLVQHGYNIIHTGRNIGGQIRADAGSSSYSLNELFYHFGDKLLYNDFTKIHSWALKTFDEGYRNVRLQADVMEKDYRAKYLWKMVKTLQDGARSIEQYNDAIGNHSTSGEWFKFKTIRQELYDLPVDF